MICPKCKKHYPDKTLFSIPFTEKEVYLYCEDCHTVTPLSKVLKAREERKQAKEEVGKTMIQTDNTTLAVAQALITLRDENKALKAENEKLKSELEIQKNLTRQACFESNRAYDEVEKWKKMFYDLVDKQSSVSTDPKVIIVGKDTDVPANAPDSTKGVEK